MVLRLVEEGVLTLLREPPEVVVAELRLAPEPELEREVLALLREVLELLREVLALERDVLVLLRDVLLLELLIVPPTALEVEAEEELLVWGVLLLREELELLREALLLEEELRDTLAEELREELEEELLRELLPPLRDWALTGDIASAIAATAASASLNVVFIMLNFSVRKYNYSE